MNTQLLSQAANESRGLAMDAVAKANSGHLGLPLGAAEIGAVLYAYGLSHNPADPEWINRDRFVLSAGHGSMFLYSWLHLSGYDLPLEELMNFRQLHSKTPGHPEFGETVGVESTTGPLGQGIGNAIGMAIAAKMAQAHFNTKEYEIFNQHVIALCGDGCLQEGVAAEAASLGGHLGLDNFILIYDSNDVTLDAAADKTQSEDVGKRFEAYGFDVVTIDGHDFGAIAESIKNAKHNDNGKAKLIIAKTTIGKGIPEVEGTAKAHGESGVKFVDAARKALGLPEHKFHVSDAVKNFFDQLKEAHIKKYNEWKETFAAWKSANPEKAELLQEGLDQKIPADLLSRIPPFTDEDKLATRAAGGTVLQAVAKAMPLLISGSADLHGSTKNYIKDASDFAKDNHTGRNFYFGIREHGMGAILNGIAYFGIFRASGATFLNFSDYMRPSVRLAALAHLPVVYIWTHDSVGVGEDGPTHQPVETVSSLRLIPNLDVIRPGDPEETAGAFVGAAEKTDGPTALILTRQSLPTQSSIPREQRRQGALKGGYIAHKEKGELQLILMASGSELQHVMVAAEKLGEGVRVVSMPCMERFDRQGATYQEEILPKSCTRRIAMEAGAGAPWYKYTGTGGKVISIERFGMSAPGNTIMQELGMTAENVIQVAKDFLPELV